MFFSRATKGDHAARVHAREPELVPRRGVHGVIEDPGVVLDGVVLDPGESGLGVERVQDVGTVEGDAVGSDPRALAVLGTFEQRPIEVANNGARVFGDPGLAQSRGRAASAKCCSEKWGFTKFVDGARRATRRSLTRRTT